nr:hypothetical protein [Sphingomonas sp. Y57]
MRHPLFIPIATASLLAMGLAGSSQAAKRAGGAEAEISKALAGRIPGKPVDCLDLNRIRSSRIIDRAAILYETDGGMLYLNRPASGAEQLRSGLTLVTDTHTPQLCSVDTVRLVDLPGHFESGWVGLGKFVPYARR